MDVVNAAAVEALSDHSRDDFGAIAAIKTDNDDGLSLLDRAATRVHEALHLLGADAHEVLARLGETLFGRRGSDVRVRVREVLCAQEERSVGSLGSSHVRSPLAPRAGRLDHSRHLVFFSPNNDPPKKKEMVCAPTVLFVPARAAIVVVIEAKEQVVTDMTTSPAKIAAFMLTKNYEAFNFPQPEEYVLLTSLCCRGDHVVGHLLCIPPDVRQSMLSRDPEEKVDVIMHPMPLFAIGTRDCATCAPAFASIKCSFVQESGTFYDLVLSESQRMSSVH